MPSSPRAVGLVNCVLQDPNPNWQAEASAFVAKVEHRLRGVLGLQADAVHLVR